MSSEKGALSPGACADPSCQVLHADHANPIHPPDYEPGGPFIDDESEVRDKSESRPARTCTCEPLLSQAALCRVHDPVASLFIESELPRLLDEHDALRRRSRTPLDAERVIEVTIGLWDKQVPPGQNPPALARAIVEALRIEGYRILSPDPFA